MKIKGFPNFHPHFKNVWDLIWKTLLTRLEAFQEPFHLVRVGASDHHKPAQVRFFQRIRRHGCETDDYTFAIFNSPFNLLMRYFKVPVKMCVWSLYPEEVGSWAEDWILPPADLSMQCFLTKYLVRNAEDKMWTMWYPGDLGGWPTMHNVPYAASSWRSIGYPAYPWPPV